MFPLARSLRSNFQLNAKSVVADYEDMTIKPWAQASESSGFSASIVDEWGGGRPNVWGERGDTERLLRGHPQAARYLARNLLEAEFDTAYAYRPLHHPGLAPARIPWRVAVVASSSWSHAFLCDKTYRLAPDVAADRLLYQAMQAGDFEYWRNYTLDQIQDSEQQEILNWHPLPGAMQEIGAKLEYSDFVETGIFNSSKVAAVYAPV